MIPENYFENVNFCVLIFMNDDIARLCGPILFTMRESFTWWYFIG